MKSSRVVSLIVLLLISLSLLLFSCGPAATTTTAPPPGETTSSGAQPPVTGVTTAPPASPDKPQYGGQVSILTMEIVRAFDEVTGTHPAAHTLKLTNDELIRGDWTKGPAGTNQVDWAVRGVGRLDLVAGNLAESWEIPQQGTIIFHIRQGVHWALNPNSEASRLVAGRELTAEDVRFCLNEYATNPRAYLNNSVAGVKDAKITAPDKYTIKVETTPDYFEAVVSRLGDFASIFPPEVYKKYGNMSDWKVSVGTGPFILTDYVEGSSATFVRNSNYWDTDPIGPGKGNELPYLDGVKYLIISDLSTNLAALRTGKGDVMRNIGWEDAANLMKMSPDLKYKKFMSDGGQATFMRTDKAELPFKDIRVRRAMMMATDFETIKNDYCGGDALIVSWPITRVREYENAHLSLEEAPASVQELYKYNPDRSKQLLAEAGYPNGFKTKIVCQNSESNIDYLSILKDMWAKVGIDLTIDPKEAAVFTNIQRNRAYDEMSLQTQGPVGMLYRAEYYNGSVMVNGSYVSEPKAAEMRMQMQLNALTNTAEADRIHKDFMKYVLDQAWAIPYTYAPSYHFWWPWLKNFNGEMSVGYDNSFVFTKWAWVDQDMKASMTGRR